jgi:hypothetical protein
VQFGIEPKSALDQILIVSECMAAFGHRYTMVSSEVQAVVNFLLDASRTGNKTRNHRLPFRRWVAACKIAWHPEEIYRLGKGIAEVRKYGTVLKCCSKQVHEGLYIRTPEFFIIFFQGSDCLSVCVSRVMNLGADLANSSNRLTD